MSRKQGLLVNHVLVIVYLFVFLYRTIKSSLQGISTSLNIYYLLASNYEDLVLKVYFP